MTLDPQTLSDWRAVCEKATVEGNRVYFGGFADNAALVRLLAALPAALDEIERLRMMNRELEAQVKLLSAVANEQLEAEVQRRLTEENDE